MATKRIRCHCGGKPSCRLCGGTGKYDYDPGPMGYVPFRCPNCDGQRTLADDDGSRYPCSTCRGRDGGPGPPTAGGDVGRADQDPLRGVIAGFTHFDDEAASG